MSPAATAAVALPENVDDLFVQTLHLARRQITGLFTRIQLSREQDFASRRIPDTGQKRLIEQSFGDGQRTSDQVTLNLVQWIRLLQGVRAE